MIALERVESLAERVQRCVWAEEENKQSVLETLLRMRKSLITLADYEQRLAEIPAALDELENYLNTLPQIDTP